jgi:hypothetical protein
MTPDGVRSGTHPTSSSGENATQPAGAVRPDRATAGHPQAPEFWQAPEIVAALRAEHAGQLLVAYRQCFNPRLSQKRLAQILDTRQPAISRAENQTGPVMNRRQLTQWFERLHVPQNLWWFEPELIDPQPIKRQERRLPTSTTLYRFFDADGDLLYVGITHMETMRWRQHSKTKDWWREVTTIKVAHFDTRDEALAAEAKAIRQERPRHNIKLATAGPLARPPRPLWIPPDELIPTADAAAILGIALRSVSAYRTHYPWFPEPALRETSPPLRVFWWRPEIEWFRDLHNAQDRSLARRNG